MEWILVLVVPLVTILGAWWISRLHRLEDEAWEERQRRKRDEKRDIHPED
jgi:hypothetical protein